VSVGIRRWVEEITVTKKIILDGNIFFDGVFVSHLIWSSTKFFHVGLKEIFCERGGWIRVDNNCFQFFHPLLYR